MGAEREPPLEGNSAFLALLALYIAISPPHRASGREPLLCVCVCVDMAMDSGPERGRKVSSEAQKCRGGGGGGGSFRRVLSPAGPKINDLSPLFLAVPLPYRQLPTDRPTNLLNELERARSANSTLAAQLTVIFHWLPSKEIGREREREFVALRSGCLRRLSGATFSD